MRIAVGVGGCLYLHVSCYYEFKQWFIIIFCIIIQINLYNGRQVYVMTRTWTLQLTIQGV